MQKKIENAKLGRHKRQEKKEGKRKRHLSFVFSLETRPGITRCKLHLQKSGLVEIN